MTGDAALILAFCEALMQADTLEAAVQGATRGVCEATGSEACGIVIVLHSGVFLEAWHPIEHMDRLERFQAVKKVVMHSAANGVATLEPLEENTATPAWIRSIHFPLTHRLNGGICVVSPCRPAFGESAGPSVLDRLAQVISLRLCGLLEIDAERRKSQQFERWFKVSDRQIRALDLERQKFAALVSSFAGGAFVATREGTITWQSRPLLERHDSGPNTWVGRGCRELCRALGSGGHPACGNCLVNRVLESHQPSSNDTVFIEDGEERIVRVAAAPINDLAGRAQEIVVTFQDVLPMDRSAAA